MRLLRNVCLVTILLTIGGLFSCSDKDSNDIDMSLLLGQWKMVAVNGDSVLTDSAWIMQFYDSPAVEMFASSVSLSANNEKWIECSEYTYKVDGSTLEISGTDALGKEILSRIKILDVDANSFRYETLLYEYDGADMHDTNVYSMERVSSQLPVVGLWKGHETSADYVGADYYWQYFENGKFDYYYYDSSAGSYVLKTDNNGEYFLYGDFLALNYNNDGNTGVEGQFFECWNIKIEGDTMTWSGLRENGVVKSFRMERCSSINK